MKTPAILMEYIVWNVTDDRPAAPLPMTAANALKFMHDFRDRYRKQGFYRTAKGTQIEANQIELKMEPCTDPPEAAPVEKELIALLADMEAAREAMESARAAVLAKFRRARNVHQ